MAMFKQNNTYKGACAYATAYMYHNLYEFFPNREKIKYKLVLTLYFIFIQLFL